MMWDQLDFFLVISITLSFQIKKLKFQMFPRVYLWPQSVKTKFLDFAAGMEIDT